MVHPINPILGRLALGLILLAPVPVAAAAAGGGVPEYSGPAAAGLASREAQQGPAAPEGRTRTAQAMPPEDDDPAAAARGRLQNELGLIRRQTGRENAGAAFDPPLPVRRKAGQPLAEPAGLQAPQSQANPQIDRLTGQLLLMYFRGSQPSDSGPRAIRTLLQSGLIAGAVFGRENIQGKAQLKELIKFFLAPGAPGRPFLAIREIGGTTDTLPPVRDFEQWPSETEVAAKGDPQYAYSTYSSLGAALAGFGFNLNFGPVLAAPGANPDMAAGFGGDPLQAGVFAKTFMLGHREQNIIAVPVVDGSAYSLRALKMLLISDPGLAIGSPFRDGIAPFLAYEGLVKGARFCFAVPAPGTAGAIALSGFQGGCDILVLDGGAESPAAVRDRVALALSQAVQTGELSLDTLEAAAQRANELRSLIQHDWPAAPAR